MKKIAALVFLATMCSPAYAFDPLDKTDIAMLTAYTALHVIDWRQTRQIARNPDKYFEYNPIMGKRPTVDRVDKYMAASLLTTWAVSCVLPKEYRSFFLGASITIKASLIGHNVAIGLSF